MGNQDHREHASRFEWRHGKELVVLSRAGDGWQVSWLSQGRLLGPRQTVYQVVHRQAKHAAWDVMARVISASHDEEEGVQAGMQAAQWMRRAEPAQAG